MCKFCQNYDKSDSEMRTGDVFITQSAKYTYVGDGREYHIPLRFCPACGRALDVAFKNSVIDPQRPCNACGLSGTCSDFLFKDCAINNWYHYRENKGVSL